MRVIDPGHTYMLQMVDAPVPGQEASLSFVKRYGDKYPGNNSRHGGPIMQEVLRALIDRCEYVNNQAYSPETEAAQGLLKAALVLLELRADRIAGRQVASVDEYLYHSTCEKCGHVMCGGECR